MDTKNAVCTTRMEWRWEQVHPCILKNHHEIRGTHLVVAYLVESLTNSCFGESKEPGTALRI